MKPDPLDFQMADRISATSTVFAVYQQNKDDDFTIIPLQASASFFSAFK